MGSVQLPDDGLGEKQRIESLPMGPISSFPEYSGVEVGVIFEIAQ